MRFIETALPGAWIIELEPHSDERGFFARTFCAREFQARGLNTGIAQCNVSFNKRRGTLRGMHWQAAPYAETKLVRITRGAIHDIIVDIRPDSPAYLQHVAVELTDGNDRMLYVPEGFAHGFQTLVDETEVFYQMSEFYAPECAHGARWDDPAFGLEWPLPNPILNERDRAYSDFGR